MQQPFWAIHHPGYNLKAMLQKLFAPLIAAGLLAGFALVPTAHAQSKGHVYELRTYTAVEGRLADVVARFRDHTTKLFEKHGMKNIGYWIPQDPARSKDTLIYILEHQSLDAAKKSWDAFRSDPEWVKVRAETEAKGPIVAKVVSVYMDPTDFSPLK